MKLFADWMKSSNIREVINQWLCLIHRLKGGGAVATPKNKYCTRN